MTDPVRGQVISTIAGPGNTKTDLQNSISNANGVAVDDSGNVYVVEYWDAVELLGSIFKFNPDDSLNKRRGVNTTGEMLPPPPAHLSYPHGIVVDHEHNIYVAEFSSHVVKKVTPQGKVTLLAGNGAPGYTGDKGNATAATLSLLNGIALDHLGNLYLADGFNNVIRKINSRGIISTFAGTGVEGYRSDGFQATRAELNGPYGIAADDTGNVYFSDSRNNVIRKVNPTGIISTIAGNGKEGYSGDGGPAAEARLNKPAGIAADNFGNVYVADEGNSVVRKIAADGIITTIAGSGRNGYDGDGGPATSAALSGPRDVAIDSKGNMYIADFGNHVIRKVKIKLPFVPPPPARIRPLVAALASIAAAPSTVLLSTVMIPAFVSPELVDNLTLLPAVALTIATPDAFTPPGPVTAPNFVTPEQMDKVSLLPAATLPANAPTALTMPTTAMVPTFIQPEQFDKMPVLSVVALAIVAATSIPLPSLVAIPTFTAPPSGLALPILPVVTFSIAVFNVFKQLPTVAVPTFVGPAAIDKIDLLPGLPLTISLPPSLIPQSLTTVPTFVTPAAIDQIPMLAGMPLTVSKPTAATSPPLATVPTFVTPTNIDQIQVLPELPVAVSKPSIAAPPSVVEIPKFNTPTEIDRISVMTGPSFPVTLPSIAAVTGFARIPTIDIGAIDDAPPVDKEDKVTISISPDNVMTINSEKGSYTSLTITNMKGEKLTEQALKGKQSDVDVTMLPPGQYYINLKADKSEGKTLRFVKQN